VEGERLADEVRIMTFSQEEQEVISRETDDEGGFVDGPIERKRAMLAALETALAVKMVVVDPPFSSDLRESTSEAFLNLSRALRRGVRPL